MEQFGLDQDLASTEHELAALQGPARLTLLVTLAWYLRQRDCPRALCLADEADTLLAQVEAPNPAHLGLVARVMLLRAEIKLLFADIAAARQLTRSAAELFRTLTDHQGLGDTYWLEASLHVDQGHGPQVDSCIDSALAQYRLASDPLRLAAGLARRLIHAAFRDPVTTASELRQMFPPDEAQPSSVTCWVAAAQANVAGLTNDPGSAIQHDLEGYHAALQCGQIRQALVSVTNAAESFATLGDLDAALQWSETALALARKTAWPASIGFCLVQIGDVLRLLTRYDEANTCLREALVLMSAQAGSRNHEQALHNLAQLALDQGDHAAGLASFVKLEAHVARHQEPDLLIKVWRGQASALFHLGQAAQASAKANAALALAREHGHADGQIQALRVLAQIHTEPSLSPPDDMTAPSAALHYLDQAARIASTMGGYSMPPDYLDQVAAAYADCGDFRAAYEHGKAADSARNKSRRLAAQRRAVALQIRLQLDQARAETEHQRHLTETLRDTAATLETLGTIGREITANLNTGAVFESLHSHVHRLLDATAFAVFLINPEQTLLEPVYFIEAGEPVQARNIALDSDISYCARCARERREIVIDLPAGADEPNRIPGTLATLSLLYAPLIVNERLLGVMTIQSPKLKAYGERERSIFITLCAYGAIALDNAAAYGAAAAARQRADQALQELSQTQTQLVRDVTERQRIAQELHELNSELETRIALRTREMSDALAMLALSKSKLQAIVDTALDAVVRADANGVIIGWNARAETIFGWSAGDALGKRLHDTIIPPRFRSAHLRGVARYLDSGESSVIDRIVEIAALHRSGREFPIELAITRVSLDESARFEFCAFIRDITQRKQAEEEIRTSLEKQRELNQLKSRFVSMASHEFRTPLATILSSTDLLRLFSERMPASEREDLFQSISVAVHRMTRMLEDILVIGKGEAERTEFCPVSLSPADLCTAIVDELQWELERAGAARRDVRLAITGDAAHGRLDEKLMRHIFSNLLTNAAKYSPSGQSIDFTVHGGAHGFTFSVSDHGIGIPEADLPRLFETFHRAANVGNIAGTGLGLAIVKRSVQLHGGTISVQSQLGQGSTFTVSLPRMD